jgi:hypothetical protein
MKAAAASANPVKSAAMQEYAKISLRTLAIARSPRVASSYFHRHLKATPAPWRKGEISLT